MAVAAVSDGDGGALPDAGALPDTGAFPDAGAAADAAVSGLGASVFSLFFSNFSTKIFYSFC